MVRVVTVCKHSPPAPHHCVKPPSQPDRESLKPSRERPLVRCHYDEVKVVSLNREVDDAEPLTVAKTQERRGNRGETPPAAKVPDVREHSPRYMDRVVSRQLGTRAMANAGPRALRFPARASPRTSPGTQIQLELLWPARHLDWAQYNQGPTSLGPRFFQGEL